MTKSIYDSSKRVKMSTAIDDSELTLGKKVPDALRLISGILMTYFFLKREKTKNSLVEIDLIFRDIKLHGAAKCRHSKYRFD